MSTEVHTDTHTLYSTDLCTNMYQPLCLASARYYQLSNLVVFIHDCLTKLKSENLLLMFK